MVPADWNDHLQTRWYLADAMTRYEHLLAVLEGAFDVVRRGDDGPYLAQNTLSALGINEDERR